MCRRVVLLAVALAVIPTAAQAYVDPGLVSMVIQGLFAAVAGFTAAYILGPWRWIMSFFSTSAQKHGDRNKDPRTGEGSLEMNRDNQSS